jgi:hypothetical protein
MAEPDWEKLAAISARAELASQEPGWNMETWNALCEEATVATNGHPRFSEFMARYLPWSAGLAGLEP